MPIIRITTVDGRTETYPLEKERAKLETPPTFVTIRDGGDVIAYHENVVSRVDMTGRRVRVTLVGGHKPEEHQLGEAGTNVDVPESFVTVTDGADVHAIHERSVTRVEMSEFDS